MGLKLSRFVEAYISAHELAWAKTTLKTERSRLGALGELVDLEPKELYLKLNTSLKPYTLQNLFVRLAAFEAWTIEQGLLPGPMNRFRTFNQSHANLFKHTYKKEVLEVSFEEAERRIVSELTGAIREKALDLLYTGMRYNESFSEGPGNYIEGKGKKVRKIYRPNPPKSYGGKMAESEFSYQTFWRKLKEIGLKPHTLRKLWATRLIHTGNVDALDLCELAGWSSFQTAAKYLQVRREVELNQKVQKAFLLGT